MFAHPGRIIGSRNGPYRTPTPSNYDGSNDYALRGGNLTGISDGKEGTISFWLDLNGGDGSGMSIFNIQNRVLFQRDSANRFDWSLRNSSATIIGRRETTDTYLASGSFLHFIASWDLAATTIDFYVNGAVPNLNGGSSVTTNDTIDYTSAETSVGATAASGGDKLNGCLSEVFFHTSYIDLSAASNLAKFRSLDGKPVNLGTNGQLPLGVQPLLYAPDGDPSDNKGTGGDFTITGALTACATRP